MATLDSTKASKKESLGEISYKLVDSVQGYQLNDQEGLAKFSSTQNIHTYRYVILYKFMYNIIHTCKPYEHYHHV